MTDRTILVADDEPHLAQIIAFNLRRAGAIVTTARHGAEALAAIGRCRPDLLVTDYQMPILNGLDLCRALKQDPATADLPVVMLTARGHRLTPAEMGQTNIRRLMSKPFSAADLLAQVREVFLTAPGAAVPIVTVAPSAPNRS